MTEAIERYLYSQVSQSSLEHSFGRARGQERTVLAAARSPVVEPVAVDRLRGCRLDRLDKVTFGFRED